MRAILGFQAFNADAVLFVVNPLDERDCGFVRRLLAHTRSPRQPLRVVDFLTTTACDRARQRVQQRHVSFVLAGQGDAQDGHVNEAL